MCLSWFKPKPKPPIPPVPPDPPMPEPIPRINLVVEVLDLLGARGEINTFIHKLRDCLAGGIRACVCYSWNSTQPISPYRRVGEWTHDNGIMFPLYRLSEWNEEFWVHLNRALTAMAEAGLTIWLDVEDFCSLKGDSRQKYYNPFYSSEEALGPNTPGGVWGDAMWPYHLALIDRTIAACRAAGVDFLIAPMNEYDAPDWSDVHMIDWHKRAVEAMLERGVPVDHIYTSAMRNHGWVSLRTGLYSIHGVGRPDQIKEAWQIPIYKTIFSSDGYWGGTGEADVKGRQGPGFQAIEGIVMALEAGPFRKMFHYLPRGLYAENNDQANLELVNEEYLLAFTEPKKA